MSGRAFYSRAHYRRLRNGGPDTPEQVAERETHRQAAALAIADREKRFPALTADNAGEAMAYQEERIAFHRAALARARGGR